MVRGRKIRVAMYCPFFLPAYGGAELATLSLAREMQHLCNVELYTFNWTQDLDKKNNYKLHFSCDFPRKEVIDGVPIHRYSIANLPIVRSFSARLALDMKLCDADIIHFQGVTKLFSRLLSQMTDDRKIKVLSTHGLQEALEIMRQKKYGFLTRPFFTKSLRKIDHIIALSNSDLSFLLYQNLDKSRITLIPNGIDAARFEKRRKFVERNGKLKILCVARFDKNKNYESLILALSKLKNDLEFKAYFVGGLTDLEYFKKITRLVKKNALESFVNIGLSLDDPALVDCYLSSDLFVLPSDVETFSLVILEAMYAGLPIISTPVGYAPYIIKNGVNGFIIPKNDPMKLYEKCLKLLKDERMRKMMGNANKEVARNYTWSKIASSTYNLYQQLMEKRAQRQSSVI